MARGTGGLCGLVLAGAAALLALGLAPGTARAVPGFLKEVPAGYEQSCDLCHTQPPSLNDFGRSFRDNGFRFPQPAAAHAESAPEKPAASAPGPTGGLSSAVAPAAPRRVGGAAEPQSAGRQAGASEPKVELIVPQEAVRGQKIQLRARVTLDGRPLAGQEVLFLEATDLFLDGLMELGRAVTDERGTAAINYWPRATNGEARIAARLTEAGDRTEDASAALRVVPSGPLVERPAGLKVPFFGAWVIAALLIAVWETYAYAIYSIGRIRRLGRLVERRAAPEETAAGRPAAEEKKYASAQG